MGSVKCGSGGTVIWCEARGSPFGVVKRGVPVGIYSHCEHEKDDLPAQIALRHRNSRGYFRLANSVEVP
jgi:hypothetical protein